MAPNIEIVKFVSTEAFRADPHIAKTLVSVVDRFKSYGLLE